MTVVRSDPGFRKFPFAAIGASTWGEKGVRKVA